MTRREQLRKELREAYISWAFELAYHDDIADVIEAEYIVRRLERELNND